MLYSKRGFTLVELIVVITILAIMATIGFLSFQGYTTSARDSTRLSEVRSIHKLLDLYKIKNDTYPLPDDSIAITASGTTVGYQGNAGKTVFVTIGYSNAGVDPLDNILYPYYVVENGVSMQLMTLLEQPIGASLSPQIIPSSFAADYSARIPKFSGSKLGMLTDSNNVPAHSLTGATDIDVVKTVDSFIAHVDDTTTYIGTGSSLRYTVPLSSCKRIGEAGLGGPSGYYTIYPIGESPKEVYCRFVDGEGFTMIARSIDNTDFDGSDFGWFVSTGSVTDDSRPYSLGDMIQDIPFEDIYLGVHNGGKTFSGGVTQLTVTDLDLFDGTYTNTGKTVDNCSGIPITIFFNGNPGIPVDLPDSCLAFSYWGNFGSTQSYFFSPDPDPSGDGLNPRRFGATFPYEGLIFVK